MLRGGRGGGECYVCVGAGVSGNWGYGVVSSRRGVEVGGSCFSLTTILSQVQPLLDNAMIFFLRIMMGFNTYTAYFLSLSFVCTYPAR